MVVFHDKAVKTHLSSPAHKYRWWKSILFSLRFVNGIGDDIDSCSNVHHAHARPNPQWKHSLLVQAKLAVMIRWWKYFLVVLYNLTLHPSLQGVPPCGDLHALPHCLLLLWAYSPHTPQLLPPSGTLLFHQVSKINLVKSHHCWLSWTWGEGFGGDDPHVSVAWDTGA